jgi:hypothetical protein
MKLSKALSEKKAAQNALARLISARYKTLYYDKSKGPELKFEELEKEIKSKIKRIDDLKMRILYTNCHTRLENGMLLQEAIIKLGNLRSELQSYNLMLEKDAEDRIVYSGGKAKIKEYVPQVDKKYLMKKIEELEAQKYELDALIAKANNTVDIIEKIPKKKTTQKRLK